MEIAVSSLGLAKLFVTDPSWLKGAITTMVKMGRKKSSSGLGCILTILAFAWIAGNLETVLPLLLGVGILWICIAHFLSRRQRKWLGGLTLNDLDSLSGENFELWIASQLRANGIEAENIQHRGDFGVDVIATIGKIRIGIQAKRYSKNVGNDAIQQAVSGSDYHDCQAAAVVTQSGFTKAAIAQAQKTRMPIVLIGRKEILNLAPTIESLAHSI